MTKLYSFCIFLSFIIYNNCQVENPIIKIKNGFIRGNQKTLNDTLVYTEFLGIPYGAPPVLENRFKKSVPAADWSGIRNATNFGPSCHHLVAMLYPFIEMSGDVSEDCLTINVWVPGDIQTKRNLPVLLYIYGGLFVIGTGEMYPGYDLALNGNVIVANMNYRLGSLGFMSTSDSEAKGNYGLWDCALALKWVKDNIKAFGGDPNRITVFGESAGAVLTNHLMVSPETSDLIQGAIAHSGSANGYFGITKSSAAIRNTKDLASLVGCEYLRTSEIVECLRNEDPYELEFWSVISHIVFDGKVPNWRPVVDNEIILKSPRDMWLEGYGKNVSFMTGKLVHDGAQFVLLNPLGLFELGDELSVARDNETLEMYLEFITKQYEPLDDQLRNELKNFYPGLESSDFLVRTKETIRMVTDMAFGSGLHVDASLHADKTTKSTYNYDMEYSFSFQNYPDYVNGSHVDDCFALFGEPFMKFAREHSSTRTGEWKESDFKFMNNMRSYWYNFAETGDPNKGSHPVPAEWPQFTAKNNLKLRITENMGNFSEEVETQDQLRLFRIFNERFYSNPDDTKTREVLNSKVDRKDEIAVEKRLQEVLPIFKKLISKNLSKFPAQKYKLLNQIEKFIGKRHEKLMKKHIKL